MIRPETDLTVHELRTTAAALLEIVRRLTLTDESRGPADDRLPPVRLAPLDRRTPLGLLVEIALTNPAAVAVFRVMVCAERNRHVYEALRRLSRNSTVGIPVDALVTLAEALGLGELQVLAALSPSGPLIKNGLLDGSRDDGPTLARSFSVPDRVLQMLVDGTEEPPGDLPLAREPIRRLADLRLAEVEAGEASLADQVREHLAHLDGAPLWITGPQGVGRRTLVAALAAERGLRTLCLDHRLIRKRKPDELLPILWREVLLQRALILVHDVESSDEGVPASQLCTAFGRAGLPVVFASDAVPALGDFDTPPGLVQMPAPDERIRVAMWQSLIPDCPGLDSLASRFRLTPGRIRRVAETALEAAHAAGRAITLDDIARAVSRSVGQRVATLGTKIEDSQTWQDVVLPPDTLDAVREMVSRVRYRHRVLDEWGFHGKVAKGTGVVALFGGPPGTGKTMVAGLIARELGLELYQVDLSRVVSKWVGETEKNLAQVFDAAEGANVMLLFDEADSLFARRTEVKSTHDKHSNAETNYLLQRVERFEGVCVLTTNFEGSIDPAFRRRLAFRINFPMPEAPERALLWRRMLPAQAAVAAGIDHDKLARRFELSGGRIRNAVLRAAFLAASEEQSISVGHLERAVALEYRDAGSLSSAGRLA